MNKMKTCVFLVLIASALTARAWNLSDNTTWLQGTLQGGLSESVSLKLTEQFRFLNEDGFNYYRHTQLLSLIHI